MIEEGNPLDDVGSRPRPPIATPTRRFTEGLLFSAQPFGIDEVTAAQWRDVRRCPHGKQRVVGWLNGDVGFRLPCNVGIDATNGRGEEMNDEATTVAEHDITIGRRPAAFIEDFYACRRDLAQLRSLGNDLS